MRNACMAAIVFAAFCLAQDKNARAEPEYRMTVPEMVGESAIKWTVSERMSDGTYAEPVTYKIDFDKARMYVDGEERAFSREEAAKFKPLFKMRQQINSIADKYAKESTLWWLGGEGVRLDRGDPHPEDAPKRREKNNVATTVKVGFAGK